MILKGVDNLNISNDYGVKDVKTLEGIEAIRLRPGIGPEWKN